MYIDRDGGLSAGVRQYFNLYEDKGVFIGAATRYISNTAFSGYCDKWQLGQYPGDINDDYASLGFTIGYKYIYNDKISVDAFIGGGRILWEARDQSYRGSR